MQKTGETWEKHERVELKTAEFAREARNRAADPTLRYRRTKQTTNERVGTNVLIPKDQRF